MSAPKQTPTRIPATALPWRIAASDLKTIVGDETVDAATYRICGPNATVGEIYRQGDAIALKAMLGRNESAGRVVELEGLIRRALNRIGTNGRPHPNDISWAREILSAALENREVQP